METGRSRGNGEKQSDTTRDFVDAADVKGQFLYRKDGYILTYLRIFPYNLDLLSHGEQQGMSENLAATAKDDRKDFDYFSLPREVDLDKYKQLLKEKHMQEMNIGKRHMLNIMLEHCARIVMGGENYEHQHFVKIWQPANRTNRKNVEETLAERIKSFETRYKSVGIQCEILQEAEIIKLCNLFGNNLQAGYEVYDDNVMFSPIPFIKTEQG